MPGKGETKDRHLKLELDTDDLYNAFQNIKKHEGIRSNTDVLRYFILRRNREITRDYSFLEAVIGEVLEKMERGKKEGK